MKLIFHVALAALWVASAFNTLHAQKHDYRMTLGYGSTPGIEIVGGTDIDFNSWTPATSYVFRPMDFTYNAATICDEQGNLLFYTNGCSINGADHQQILNGDELNPGIIHDAFCHNGYRAEQGSTFVPHPGNPNLYYLFHLGVNFYDSIGGVGDKFYYTLIDKTLDNGHGAVIEKNQILLEDTLAFGLITLTRHANGRDWWIIVPEMSTPKHYVFRLTSHGIFGPTEQVIGNVHFDDDGVGNAVFSPDGTKYARFDWYNQLDLFDFDRCAGIFSNPRHYSILEPTDTLPGVGGVAFSPNSRFLYLTTHTKIFQYDTQTANPETSRILIDTFDGGQVANQPALFFLPQLGPDGRIYICSGSAIPVMHLIEWPDRAGAAAKVVQRGFPLPTYNAWAMCFFPNFRLGSVDGSSCDTVGLNNFPLANFRWNTEDTLLPTTITFTDLSAYEPNVWHWDFGDGHTSQDTNPVHVYEEEASYNVCLTVSNSNGTDTICRLLHLGINTTQYPAGTTDEIVVYPNPFTSSIWVKLFWEDPVNSRISIYNVNGYRLADQQWTGKTLEWDLSILQPGIYFYRVQMEGGSVKSGRIIKIK